MDVYPTPTPPTAADPQVNAPPPPLHSPKLRLMCSYGGHIVPRPHNKSLFYAGGDTRIVAVDRRTIGSSLHSLTSHLSKTLFNNRPFLLKYQLPDSDLDSLISVTTDDDLQNMLEEHDRISNTAPVSPTPSRIRLFLFPTRPESIGSALLDAKAESWFSDALKGTRIVQRGHSADSGLLLDGSDLNSAPVECLSGEAKLGLDFGGGSVPESVNMETNSSFGSTGSSVSMSNLPAVGVGVQSEDGSGILTEKKFVRLPSSASIESDNSTGSAGVQARTGIYQEPLIQVASALPSDVVSPEAGVFDPSFALQTQKPLQVSGHSQPTDVKQHRQEVHYIHDGAYYIQPYPGGQLPVPVSSYYPMYRSPMQQQHGAYPLNQPYPVYLVPVRSTQPYNVPANYNIVNAAPPVASSQPHIVPQTMISSSVAYKDVTTSQPLYESTSKIYGVTPATTPMVSIPSTLSQQQVARPSEPQHTQQADTAVADSSLVNELDDDPAYTQIYKTQPPAPAFISQCHLMAEGPTVMLSEPSNQLFTNGTKQQVASHPQ